MSSPTLISTDTGLEVTNLDGDTAFEERRLHTRDLVTQMEGLRRLTHAFVKSPDTLLQELVSTALDLCGADSAGISIEKEGAIDSCFYEWIATAGEYAAFQNATLPRYPSACGICIERGRPQGFRVTQRFFDLMGVDAPIVTDGILLPWEANGVRGTIWIMSHTSSMAFDSEDLRLAQVLADFASMAIRHKQQQNTLLNQAAAAATAEMANELAHQINNPLQSLTNIVYLAEHGVSATVTKSLAQEMSGHLSRLSKVVSRLLSLPHGGSGRDRINPAGQRPEGN